MKKIIYVAILLVVLGGGFYILNNYVYQEKQGGELPKDFKEVTFYVSGEEVALVNGEVKAVTALGGDSETTIRYFGNEVEHDIDGDGENDVVFLITQDAEEIGTFFYAVGALKRTDGYLGTHAVYIGEGVVPQTTEKGEGRQVVVNYVERAPGALSSAQPSVGRSLHLLLDTETLQFGEVVKDFEGEERSI